MISYLKKRNHFWANKKKEMCEYDVLWSGIVRHALRNAVLPCMTLMATNLSGLICGSFAIETIFSWNGIGKFAVESVKAKDLPVVERYIVTVALTYTAAKANGLSDVVWNEAQRQSHKERAGVASLSGSLEHSSLWSGSGF